MKKWEQNQHLTPAITVVIAVYNKPEVLRLCLEGYRRQSLLKQKNKTFQLILADDGSSEEIEKIFLEFSKTVPFRTTFLHQEDYGWGKLRMLNWSILEAKADQIVFTDGDCIPHGYFVQAHLEAFENNAVLCGRRTELMEDLSQEFKLEDVREGKLDSLFWLLKQIVRKQTAFGEHGIFLPLFFSRQVIRFAKNPYPTIVGCNFSIHKKWLLELNGFDETFTRPGIGEDTDLERRLRMLPLNFKWVTYRALQFHLWHPLTQISEESKQTYEMLKTKGNRTALKGIHELKGL